jgi:NAD(P)-dependent dehydrogenase (short-subunit alcohol dehydrogenase family)
MTSNTILVLGAGPRVGYSVARKFRAQGYNVAVGSRKPDTEAATKAGFLPITVDLTAIQSVEESFVQITKEYGPPNIVVYNGKLPFLQPMSYIGLSYFFNVAATVTFPKDFANPFATIDPEAFVKDLNLNLVGAYVAMREAVTGFDQLEVDIPKVFIATGNVLPWRPNAAGATLGSGKAALTHLVAIGAEAYEGSNYR